MYLTATSRSKTIWRSTLAHQYLQLNAFVPIQVRIILRKSNGATLILIEVQACVGCHSKGVVKPAIPILTLTIYVNATHMRSNAFPIPPSSLLFVVLQRFRLGFNLRGRGADTSRGWGTSPTGSSAIAGRGGVCLIILIRGARRRPRPAEGDDGAAGTSSASSPVSGRTAPI